MSHRCNRLDWAPATGLAEVRQLLQLSLDDTPGDNRDALPAQVLARVDPSRRAGRHDVGSPGGHPGDRVELLLPLGSGLDRAVERVIAVRQHSLKGGGQTPTISVWVRTPSTLPSASWKSLSIPVTVLPSAATTRYGGCESPANRMTPASLIDCGRALCSAGTPELDAEAAPCDEPPDEQPTSAARGGEGDRGHGQSADEATTHGLDLLWLGPGGLNGSACSGGCGSGGHPLSCRAEFNVDDMDERRR